MIYTSSFFSEKIKGRIVVSIARNEPSGFSGIVKCKKLAPSWALIDQWKQSTKRKEDWEIYTRDYEHLVLEKLDPNECGELLQGATLLCYEPSSNPYCHRHLVASWLRKAGFEVAEL